MVDPKLMPKQFIYVGSEGGGIMKVHRCIFCGVSELGSDQVRCMNTTHCFDVVPVSPPEGKLCKHGKDINGYCTKCSWGKMHVDAMKALDTKPKPRKTSKNMSKEEHFKIFNSVMGDIPGAKEAFDKGWEDARKDQKKPRKEDHRDKCARLFALDGKLPQKPRKQDGFSTPLEGMKQMKELYNHYNRPLQKPRKRIKINTRLSIILWLPTPDDHKVDMIIKLIQNNYRRRKN